MTEKGSIQHVEKWSGVSPLRILAVSALWQGANDYAFVRAFRRAGHSVTVISANSYFPTWEGKGLRILRRLLRPVLVAEYNRALLVAARELKVELFFVFKGDYVTPETILTIKNMGAIVIQFYPDVSFRTHGPYLPRALPLYDWIFTTKSFGLADMESQLGIHNASFLAHGFDPETHVSYPSTVEDIQRYECEASFIGNWSEKKQVLLEHIHKSIPDADFKIWGPNLWLASADTLPGYFQHSPVFGFEYAKAIGASKINVAILSEARTGASSGDQTTARTFEIPAAGGFMLHERTNEAMTYFEDGKECVFYSDPGDLVAKIKYYLEHPKERKKIAKAGHERCLSSGYSVDDRAETVLAKYAELRQPSAS